MPLNLRNKYAFDPGEARSPRVVRGLMMAVAFGFVGLLGEHVLAAGEGNQPSGPKMIKKLFVDLPSSVRPLPEPLSAPHEKPGFAIRGIKGWAWTPEQYLAEIPYLKRFKMNFLTNCYASMFDVEHHPNWFDGDSNRWWEDLPVGKKAAYEKVVKSAQEHGLQFCFSMNPNLCSKRLVNDGSTASVDLLFKHYAWMQSLGVKWFNISLDDITSGINASTQAKVVNEILHRLRAKDPEAQMIFCPTYYWGDGTLPKQRSYLEELARDLDPDIYIFWTGDAVVTSRITRRAAEIFRGIVKHRMILWDNYPVNDNHPTMHLGPVTGRDADLCEVVDGYMSNPMRTQNEINRIPLATCADYAYNPWAYDPVRSIGQAIVHLAETDAQRLALKNIVEAYPGMLIFGGGTSANPVRERFKRKVGADSRLWREGYVRRMEALAGQFREAFPQQFGTARKSLADDIEWMKAALNAKPSN